MPYRLINYHRILRWFLRRLAVGLDSANVESLRDAVPQKYRDIPIHVHSLNEIGSIPFLTELGPLVPLLQHLVPDFEIVRSSLRVHT